MSKTVAAIFDRYENAEKAANQIKEQGLKTEDISIVAKQSEGGAGTGAAMGTTGNSNMGAGAGNTAAMGAGMTNTGAVGGVGTNPVGTVGMGGNDNQGGRNVNDNVSGGVVTGGILGGLAGLLIGAGSMMIPGLGIIAAAGPITGLISGAVTGGIVGGLVDLGIPENRSRQYESDIRAGKILFSMKADEENVGKIGEILRENGAVSVDTY